MRLTFKRWQPYQRRRVVACIRFVRPCWLVVSSHKCAGSFSRDAVVHGSASQTLSKCPCNACRVRNICVLQAHVVRSPGKSQRTSAMSQFSIGSSAPLSARTTSSKNISANRTAAFRVIHSDDSEWLVSETIAPSHSSDESSCLNSSIAWLIAALIVSRYSCGLSKLGELLDHAQIRMFVLRLYRRRFCWDITGCGGHGCGFCRSMRERATKLSALPRGAD